MTPREVRVAYCAIGGKVGRYFHRQYAYNCFCDTTNRGNHFQYEQKILDFIDEAVDEKIKRDGTPKGRWKDL